MANADRAIRFAAGATVLALAGIAGAISYSHMRELAVVHGEDGWRSHAFPLSVDGIEIVASLVLLADRRAGRPSGWLPWAALVAGTAASLAANVSVGGDDPIGRIVTGWPAFALLVAIKLMAGLLDRHGLEEAVPDDPVVDQDRPDTSASDIDRPERSPAPSRRIPELVLVAEPASAGGGAPDRSVDVILSLPAARAAHESLAAQGRTLTRDSLAEQMRRDGHQVSNARVTQLLALLRSEQPSPADLVGAST